MTSPAAAAALPSFCPLLCLKPASAYAPVVMKTPLGTVEERPHIHGCEMAESLHGFVFLHMFYSCFLPT